ncbi:MAG: phosphoribosylaminoimidazolesuccinocarboxamide synthase, partial [bacterium]|nr:phosphoribosylaminoimidazolesuccinocarboxamide synthase [bacterium]
MSDKLYSGKAKDILKAENDNEVIIHFRNSLTAQNGKKKLGLDGKGELNCRITELLFKYLFDNGVKSHYLKHISKTDFLARKVKI